MIFPRGLRANIIINLAGLLLLGMILIDFVTIITVQRDLLKLEVSKGFVFLSQFNRSQMAVSETQELFLQMNADSKSNRSLYPQLYSCLLVLGRNNRVIYAEGHQCAVNEMMLSAIKESIATEKPVSHYFGTSWGVFWFQSRYLVLAQPMQHNNTTVGGLGMIVPLEGIYQKLQRSQKILTIYIVINTILLTLIGLYRLSKVYLDPIYRLVKRAEEYREDEDMLFAVRKEDNELNQLSKALNQMLLRISKDKEKLRSTVQSLEKANLDLKHAQREVLQAEKLASVGRLSSGIAHEIGNPIGIIMGYLALLKQGDISEQEREEYIGRTEEELNRVNTTIRQLLDFSRPSSEGIKPVHVHEIIDELTAVVKYQPFMSDIALTFLREAPFDIVMADAQQLRQVFLNLMINAADAIATGSNPKNGQLRIITTVLSEINDRDDISKQPQQLLQIQFIDNGHGIATENLSSIFDPFYTTKDPGKGTGLGLSVSFMIIESFGGSIKAESEIGKGSTMKIILPLSLSV